MALLERGDSVVNIDMVPPKISGTIFVQGSILDRSLLAQAMKDVDCVVHIAAWHGVHEAVKTPADFHDLNVTGTFNVLQAAADEKIQKLIFVSSTSVEDKFGLYGNSKIVGEEMARAYAERYPDMEVVTLRPRAFIPSWNKDVYKNFLEWAAWFMKGAVHINDFRDALLVALDHQPQVKAPVYIIDGAYDYSAADLNSWNSKTFEKYYPEFAALAQQYGIDTTRKPKVLEIPAEQILAGYQPKYSMRNMLEDLRTFGLQGPPAPYDISDPVKNTAAVHHKRLL